MTTATISSCADVLLITPGVATVVLDINHS